MSASIILSQYENVERVQALAGLCAQAGYAVFIAPPLYDIPESNWLWGRIAELGQPVGVKISSPVEPSLSPPSEPQASDGVEGFPEKITARLGQPLVVWSSLNPRPSEWLLKKHGIEAITFRYDSYDTVDDCFAALRSVAPLDDAPESTVAELAPHAVKFAQRWYPVVDKDRCNNCGQCLQFCLFGVHSQDNAGAIAVSHPDLCKTGCPACSRICPQGAIMFPMYAKDEAIAGAPGRLMTPDEAARRMFYTRTKKPCPVCGVVPVGSALASGDKCPECGGAAVQAVSPIGDEIDALIDALDAKS